MMDEYESWEIRLCPKPQCGSAIRPFADGETHPIHGAEKNTPRLSFVRLPYFADKFMGEYGDIMGI